MKPELKRQIIRVSDAVWEIPKDYKPGMLVPARVFATEKLLNSMDDGIFDQITNVACLPGIQKHAYCMPDGHWGYGFPIGGVAAFDLEEGIISPGGIGFDINCGVRLIRTNLTVDEVRPKMKELIDTLFKTVPSGVGRKSDLRLSMADFKELLTNGAKWCVKNNYGWKEDVEYTEENGCLPGANTEKVSEKALRRGIGQVGTLGSGNHYLEIQVVPEGGIFNPQIADTFGVNKEGQVAIMVHCGSRGLGHQVATDFLRIFDQSIRKYNIKIMDRQLACAPWTSPEGQDYYAAMACAANMAFANRQVIMHRIREGFSKVFGKTPEEMEMSLVYDVAHNIAKVESYVLDDKPRKVLVHRKGSTRSFGPGHPELPSKYRLTGQPVLLGGSMETGSHLLVGTQRAVEESFGSTAHGSGRTMSRTAARKSFRGEQIQRDMADKGIYVRAASMSGLAEEVGKAYKNLSDVVQACEESDISRKVVMLKPIGNIKG